MAPPKYYSFSVEYFVEREEPFNLPSDKFQSKGNVEKGVLVDLINRFEACPWEKSMNKADIKNLEKRVDIKFKGVPRKSVSDRISLENDNKIRKSCEDVYEIAEELFSGGEYSCGLVEPLYEKVEHFFDVQPEIKFVDSRAGRQVINPPKDKHASYQTTCLTGYMLDISLKKWRLDGTLYIVSNIDKKFEHEKLAIKNYSHKISFIYISPCSDSDRPRMHIEDCPVDFTKGDISRVLKRELKPFYEQEV